MDRKYACYCGLYCGNCATKARVDPAARALYEEMLRAGFEDVMPYLPDGDTFWAFLKGMALEGSCDSCREGSGNPACPIRTCAGEGGVEMCAHCGDYPCAHFGDLLRDYPLLAEDNALLRDKGPDAWARLQDERRAADFTYADNG